ncbi:MAG TPA: tRNA pseudouridine(13) synthase TruD [Nitrosopumilaceae archaeon]|nr:tRNA pseudouridine(13) synthase TruD [Nitrosopumilaceae archaeon]
MIPKIDTDIGISIYSTSFSGCGGKIRQNMEDFVVSEILSEKSLSSIKPSDGYAVYKLKKQNIDTNHALKEIFRRTGVRLKSLGLKDSFAITEQFVCSMNKSKTIQDFVSSKYSLKKIGFVKKPLTKKDMVGNNFQIKISEPTSDPSKFDEYDKILNFFGYQRFGSSRPVTHLIGKAILQRDFFKAIKLLVSFTSEFDSKEHTELRKKLADESNYKKLLSDVPPQMDLERIAISQMIEHNDPLKAIKALPLSIRRFFVQAYQSFVFNKTVSMAFENGEDLFLPQEGDVCFDKNGILGKYIKGLEQNLSIPLVGYFYYKKTRFDYYISHILEEEDISLKDFYIKEIQEVSNEGGYRNSSISCSNYSVNDNVVSFSLSRGSFATIVLREMIKPEDPIRSGF